MNELDKNADNSTREVEPDTTLKKAEGSASVAETVKPVSTKPSEEDGEWIDESAHREEGTKKEEKNFYKKCPNGHYYKQELQSCPFCEREDLKQKLLERASREVQANYDYGPTCYLPVVDTDNDLQSDLPF